MNKDWYKNHVAEKKRRRANEAQDAARTPIDWRRKVTARDAVIKELRARVDVLEKANTKEQ